LVGALAAAPLGLLDLSVRHVASKLVDGDVTRLEVVQVALCDTRRSERLRPGVLGVEAPVEGSLAVADRPDLLAREEVFDAIVAVGVSNLAEELVACLCIAAVDVAGSDDQVQLTQQIRSLLALGSRVVAVQVATIFGTR